MVDGRGGWYRWGTRTSVCAVMGVSGWFALDASIANACSPQYQPCGGVSLVPSTVALRHDRIAADGAIIIEANTAFDPDHGHLEVLIVDALGLGIEGTLEPLASTTWRWRPKASFTVGLQAEARLRIVVETAPEDYVDCEDRTVVVPFQVVEPLGPLVVPPLTVETELLRSTHPTLSTLSCCDGARPSIDVSPSDYGDGCKSLQYDSSRCAPNTEIVQLSVTYRVPSDAFGVDDANYLLRLVTSEETAVSFDDEVSLRLDRPTCLHFEIVDLGRDLTWRSFRCHGGDLREQLGRHARDVSQDLQACEGEPYTCTVAGEHWSDACDPPQVWSHDGTDTGGGTGDTGGEDRGHGCAVTPRATPSMLVLLPWLLRRRRRGRSAVCSRAAAPLLCGPLACTPHDSTMDMATGTSSTAAPQSEPGGESGYQFDPVEVHEPPPPPITGGTLLVTHDGAFAIASDPDRDSVHVVDLAAGVELGAIAFEAGSRPWRLAEDEQGRAHVVLRGRGEVVSFAPARADEGAAAITARRSVCSTPRGIVAQDQRLLVACASGELWALDDDTDATTAWRRLEPDLRDVWVVPDGRVHVSRFRAAEVLAVADDGSVTRSAAPLGRDDQRAHTAWRTLATDDGGWLMLHQRAPQSQLERLDVDGFLELPDACGPLVDVTLTRAAADGELEPLASLEALALVVDVALEPATGRLALAVAASCGSDCAEPRIAVTSLDELAGSRDGCVAPLWLGPPSAAQEIVAVAFAPEGVLLAQQREPAALIRIDGDGDETVIALKGESVVDTGHRLFHAQTPSGLACASCHPEGGDDGHVWWLDERVHTPALFVGLGGTEPLHWAGDLDDFDALVSETLAAHMRAGTRQHAEVGALQRWVTALREAPVRGWDDAAAAGEQVWHARGCGSCHGGESMTNNATMAIDATAVPVQVPSLRGVALHPPYFHDGHARTLVDAVREMIVRTDASELPTRDELDALVAYLETR